MGTAEITTGDKRTVVISELSKAVSYQTSIRDCLNSEDATASVSSERMQFVTIDKFYCRTMSDIQTNAFTSNRASECILCYSVTFSDVPRRG